MKNVLHIVVTIFIQLIFVFLVAAQESVTIDQKTAQELYQGIQERNELRKVVTAQNDVIAAKDKVIRELELSKQTPCSIAINSFTDSFLKLPMPSSDNSRQENKEIIKLRKQISEIWKKSIQGQCNWKADEPIWKEFLKLSPIALAIWLK